VSRRLLSACCALAVLACASSRRTHPAAHATVYELRNARWLGPAGFTSGNRFVVDGRLTTVRPSSVDSVIDLAGRWVVPPFGEAHNHNIEASGRVDALIARYLRDGVFYVENPNVLPRARGALAGKVNVPTGVDVTFANGGLTGSGGHPIELVARNVARGTWSAADGEGAFYWAIDSVPDLTRAWPRILAQRPDFIKVYLVFSEEYALRRADTAQIGWRGLDPALIPRIVALAHAAGLRVAAHVESAADFRVAVRAGVDQVAHTPGFRGERLRLDRPERFLIAPEDARLAAQRGVVVVTTLGGVAPLARDGPDSLLRRAFDAQNRANLATLRGAGVHLALGSDVYADDSRGEAAYLHSLGVFTDAELLRLWAEDTPRAIFPGRQIGTLAPGAEASFLALACDPLVRFACTDSITLRVKDGQVLRRLF
jgi:imidazolonepropionase-like amidohydrolase